MKLYAVPVVFEICAESAEEAIKIAKQLGDAAQWNFYFPTGDEGAPHVEMPRDDGRSESD